MQRNTRQRQAIKSVIERADRPLSPQEIHEAAAREAEGLGLATVYRTIKGLVEAGELTPVDVPGEPPRYEPGGKDHHHHFHCTRCGRVFEVEDCPGRLRDLAPPGFRVEGHHLTLYGVCAECAGA